MKMLLLLICLATGIPYPAPSYFYLDPLLPVADMTVDKDSITDISFADYAFIALNLTEKPKAPIKKHLSDAAMCHQYDYTTYFFPHFFDHRVFIFLKRKHCAM